jgi:hypothetical protein
VQSNILPESRTQIRVISSCPHCGSSDSFTRIQGPHVALICGSCSRWIKWVSRADAERFPAAVTCDHTQQLDRLLSHLENIDRALSVIVRVFINGGAK